MSLISFLPSSPNSSRFHKRNKNSKNHNKKKKKIPPPPPAANTKSPSSWEQFKNLLSCKDTTTATPSIKRTKKYTKLSSTCGSSICAIRDVVHGNTRVTDHRSSSDCGSHNESSPLSARAGQSMRAPPSPSRGGGIQRMKLSGCYECRAVDVHSISRRYPRPRTLCTCTVCGEVFTKSESLEQHQAIRHAVSELSPDDSSRNIVEIIFKSSWQRRNKPPMPTCSIERILKVHNTPRTISQFEDHRSTIISCRAADANMHRCAVDGNELLCFLSTPVSCYLGLNGSTSLCIATDHPPCGACTIIRHGFSKVVGPQGKIRMAASSGGAHEGRGRRAMLVCRVIAGRVKRKVEEEDGGDEVEASKLCYDSVAGDGGDLQELFVDNPSAILPCFVGIYKVSS